MHYKAFISYSHSADGMLAPALQSSLHRFAKPWYKLRNFHIFRDQTNLSATPHLWANIESALRGSEYFILMLSPEAARSKWVDKEVRFWLSQRSPETMLLILTDGELVWDDASADFDLARSSAIHPALCGVLKQEPFYLDLRDVEAIGPLSLANLRFRDRIAPLAATLRGVPASELVGEEIAQHRRAMRLARLAIAGLVVLAASASVAAVWALRQQAVALAERDQALRTQSLFLADLSRQKRINGKGAMAARLALEALPKTSNRPDRRWVVEAEGALYQAMMASWQRATVRVDESGARDAEFDHDDRRLVTVAYDGRATVWDAATAQALFSVGGGHSDNILSAAFSPDGSRLVTGSREGRVRIFDAASGALVVELERIEPRVGIQMEQVAPALARRLRLKQGEGAVVKSVQTGMPAEKAGLRAGDVLIDVDGRAVNFFRSGRLPFADVRPGSSALVHLARRDKVTRIRVRPESVNTGRASPGEIPLVRYSPDGRYILGADARMFVWDAQTGALKGTLYGDPYAISRIQYVDGDREIFAVSNSSIEPSAPRIWDSRTFSPRLALDISPLDAKGAVSIGDRTFYVFDDALATADGRRIVTLSGSGVSGLWDASSGKLIAELGPGSRGAFSPDSRYAVIANGWQAHVFDASNGDEYVILSGHKGDIRTARFSPDGRYVVTTAADKTARIWEVESGGEVAVLRPPDEEIESASFSHDGKTVVTMSEQAAVRLWAFEPFEAAVANPASYRFARNTISSDGRRRILTDSRSGVPEIWDASRASALRLEGGHSSRVVETSLSPDGHYAYTVSAESRCLWNVDRGASLRCVARPENAGERYRTGHQIDGYAVFSPDSRRLVAHSQTGETTLWELPSLKEIAVLAEPSAAISAAAFSEDGDWLVTGQGDRTTVWSARDGKRGSEFSASLRNAVYAIAPDGSSIALVGKESTLDLWRRTGERIASIKGGDEQFRTLRFSPDANILAAVSGNGDVRCFDNANGASLFDLPGLPSEEFSEVVTFSGDSRQLLALPADERLVYRVVDARSGTVLANLTGNKGPLLDAAFSPDGRRIVTASLDGTARLWDAASGVELVKLGGESKLTRERTQFEPRRPSSGWLPSMPFLRYAIVRAGFNADGEGVFTLTRDGRLRLFRVPSAEALMQLARTALPQALTHEERVASFLDPR
jgi:WD40 repeat protein